LRPRVLAQLRVQQVRQQERLAQEWKGSVPCCIALEREQRYTSRYKCRK
jgi:hypothetical protein